ncbi:uncharacterized protein LOC142335920 [Convolutriloba macropyga]|uniref:uncharacterized protein LOC142335920 n=1 Tax=Convolutriloba macropyga TaxID=536237 RepID=UPI003F524D3E
MGLDCRETLVVLCLTLSYAVAGGLVYCLGLMQSTWISELNITTTDASIINSVTFAITLLPAPLIQAARDHFNIPPFLMFATAAPLLTAGLYCTSNASTFKELLVSNGIGFGLGILFSITGSLTTVYHYFLDDKVTLATSIISSGIGFGMIAVSLSFKYIVPIVGWRDYCKYQLVLISVYVLATFIFFPPVSRPLGIRTRKFKERQMKKLKKLQKKQRERQTDERQALVNELDSGLVSRASSEPDSFTTVTEDLGFAAQYPDHIHSDSSSPYDSELTDSVLMANSALTITESIRLKTGQLWKNIMTNPPFLLLMTSWLLGEATFNAVMVHQPEREVKMGFSLQNGADTLAISGAVQLVARLGVGFLADREIVSVIRLSQFSKLTLGIFSILSNTFPSLAFQTIYMFLVGCCGGILSTTDFILVKDCVDDGRELGITVLLLVDGLFSLLSIAGAGLVYTKFNSYDAVFYTLGTASLVAFLLLLPMEFIMKRKKNPGKSGYAPIGATRPATNPHQPQLSDPRVPPVGNHWVET